MIELLTKAYEFYKSSPHLRMIMFIASQMAEEYFFTRNFQMAKRFYERVAVKYQKERWWTILARVQASLRACSLHLGLLPDYVSTSVAMLSAQLSTPAEAAPVLAHLLALVRLAPPPGAAPDGSAEPPPFPPLASPLTVEMDSAQSLLAAHVEWSEPLVHLGSSATLTVTLRSHLAVPIEFTSVHIGATDAALTTTLTTATGAATDPLALAAGGVLPLQLSYAPSVHGMVGLSLVQATLGSGSCAITLTLPMIEGPAAQADGTATTRPSTLRVDVKPPELRLELLAPPTLLLHEASAAALVLSTASDACDEGSLSIVLHAAGSPPTEDSAGFMSPNAGRLRSDVNLTPVGATAGSGTPSSGALSGYPPSGGLFSPGAQQPPPPTLLLDGQPLHGPTPMPKLEANSTHTLPLSLCTHVEGEYTLSVTAAYAAAAGLGQQSVTHTFDLRSVPALEISPQFQLDPDQLQRGHLAPHETVYSLVRVRCVAPPPATLRLRSLRLVPALAHAPKLALSSTRMAGSTPAAGAPPPLDVSDGSAAAAVSGDAPAGDAEAAPAGAAAAPEALVCPLAGTDAEVTLESDFEMGAGSEYSALFALTTLRDTPPASLGSVLVSWCRASSQLPPAPPDATRGEAAAALAAAALPTLPCEVACDLPLAEVRPAEFQLEWEVPTEGTVGGLIVLTLHIRNRSPTLRSLRLSFTENDAFLFCGHRLLNFRLPPTFTHTATFHLVPKCPGAVWLPPVSLVELPMGGVGAAQAAALAGGAAVPEETREIVRPTQRHRVFVRPAGPPQPAAQRAERPPDAEAQPGPAAPPEPLAQGA